MIHVQRRRRIRRSPAGWRFGLLAIWLGAGAAAAQERIYVAQRSPPQVHTYEFAFGGFIHQPDGGSPLVSASEAWALAASESLLFTGFPTGGVAFGALAPDGVRTPTVEGSTVNGNVLFRVGTQVLVVGSQPPAVSVVDVDPSSSSFMTQIGPRLDLGGGVVDHAALSPDGDTLYVARTQAALPSADPVIDAIDLSQLPALTHLHATAVPVSGVEFNQRPTHSLRVVSLWDEVAQSDRHFLALFRRALQFLEIGAGPEPGPPQLVASVDLDPPYPNASTRRRMYDGVFDPATARAVVAAGTRDDSGNGTGFHELLVLDLAPLVTATPGAPLVARVETEPNLFENDIWSGTMLDEGDHIFERSLDGSRFYHLHRTRAPGDPFYAQLRAYDLAPLLAGAGDIALATVQIGADEILDPDTPNIQAKALLVHDRIEPAAPAPVISGAVNDDETDPEKLLLLANDDIRTIRVSGSDLGAVSRAFLGNSWLTVVGPDGGDVLATMAALTPAGDERLGLVSGNGSLAAWNGLKVVNPPQFLPAAVAYVSNLAGNSVTVLNSASETEVATTVPTDVQGPAGVAVSGDGKFLYVSGFHDSQLSVHCLVAGAEGLPCDWNEVAATIGLHVGSGGADMVWSPDGERLYVNEIVPGVAVLDTSTVPPTLVGRIFTSLLPGLEIFRLQRAIALERSPQPPGDWLYVAVDIAPHIAVVEVSGFAGDIQEGDVIYRDVPGLPPGRARSDGLAVHPDGSRLFFTNFWSTGVHECAINPLDGSNLDCSGSIPLADAVPDVRHLAVSPDGRFLYVAARALGTTEVIEIAATPTCATPPCSVGSFDTGAGSNWARVSPNGRYIYVPAGNLNAVSVIERDLALPPLHRLLTRSSTGLSPFDVALTPGVETEVGSDVTVTPTEGVEVTFDDVTAEGNTVVTSANTSEYSLPADFEIAGGGVAVFYDVTTTAAFEGLVTVCFAYDDSGMTLVEEESLVLLHEETCSPLLDSAGATGCVAGGYGTDLLTDWTEFTCTASGVSKGDCASGQEGTTLAGYITQLPVDTASNTICGRVGSFSQFVAAVRTVWPVAIDILPGESPNELNQRSQGKLEVAIFSSALVDATAVVVSTVELAGVAAQAKSEIEDVDGDGRDDLVVKFEPPTLGLGAGAHALELTGELADGRRIRGSDSLTVK
jgi:DNA-binding beta-propeller fold protein YncE